MKKILLSILVFILLSFSVAYATDNIDVSEENNPIATAINLDDREIVENDFFKFEQKLNIEDKLIYGNMFLMGEEIKINNVQIMGSIFLLSQNIELDNVYSSGSVYFLGGDVEIKNSTFQNIYSLSQDQKIEEGTILEKDLYSVSNNIDFNGICNENASIHGENVKIGDKSSIIGKLEITSNTEPEISNPDNIGDYNFNLEKETTENEKISVKNILYSIVTYIFIASVISIIIVKLCPNFVDEVKDKKTNIVKNLLIGIALAVAIPVISIILMFSGIGLRLAFILLFLYVILLMCATSIACLVIAIKLCDKFKEKNIIKYIIITTIVVAIVKQLPVISGLFEVILGFIGLGTIFKVIFTRKNK